VIDVYRGRIVVRVLGRGGGGGSQDPKLKYESVYGISLAHTSCMLPNYMFSTKKVQEAEKPVGPIEICYNDILFGVWEEECRTPLRKATHPFEGRN
jgi:hypothetical protein